MSTKPYEIIAQPYELWVAPLGSSFPNVGNDPTSPWALIGTSGNLNYDDDGVTISHEQKIETWRSLGSTGPRKAFRTEEDMSISVKLVDVSLEQYRRALNDNAVTTTAAATQTAGSKKIGMSRGLEVKQFALLVRGRNASAYGYGNSQYEVPVAIQTGKPKPKAMKGKPMTLDLEYTVLEDLNAVSEDERFGRLVVQVSSALGSASVSPSASKSPSASPSPSA
jgi:hypothetical protein